MASPKKSQPLLTYEKHRGEITNFIENIKTLFSAVLPVFSPFVFSEILFLP